jgi:hypothetical protein
MTEPSYVYSKDELLHLRRQGLEYVLGYSVDEVLVSEAGGADVLMFPSYINGGTTYVTAEMTLPDAAQVPNAQGFNYELMMCGKRIEDWMANLIARLALYTLQAPLNPGDTLDFPFKKGSKIQVLLFAEPETLVPFKFLGKEFKLLLVMGITQEEKAYQDEHGHAALMEKLKGEKIFPVTDFERRSVVRKKKSTTGD